MTEQMKTRLGTIAALATIVISIIILAAFYYESAAVMWVLAVMNILSGPICLIMYLREAQKGVFSGENEEEIKKQ